MKKVIEYKDVSVTDANDILIKEKNKILKDFTKAYLAETEIPPSKLLLVVETISNNGIVEINYYFKKKENE